MQTKKTTKKGNQEARKKNRNAVALGRLGGAAKTPAKAAASRRNGRLGGRPKKVLESCKEGKK